MAKFAAPPEIPDDQIQPASMDLRLGNIAYRVQASFLPGRSSTLGNKIAELKIAEYDLSRPTLLETNAVYVVPLLESLALPRDIGGKANPKSTTGRLDIFTRLITDGGLEFERVPQGICRRSVRRDRAPNLSDRRKLPEQSSINSVSFGAIRRPRTVSSNNWRRKSAWSTTKMEKARRRQ